MIDLALVLSQIDDPDLRAFLDLATSPEARWAKLQTLIRKDKRWRHRIDDLMALKKDGAHDAYLLDFIINDLELKLAGMKLNAGLVRSMLPPDVIQKYETAFGELVQVYTERKRQERDTLRPEYDLNELKKVEKGKR